MSCSSSDGVILKETTPITIEIFHDQIKVISQSNFVLICSELHS